MRRASRRRPDPDPLADAQPGRPGRGPTPTSASTPRSSCCGALAAAAVRPGTDPRCRADGRARRPPRGRLLDDLDEPGRGRTLRHPGAPPARDSAPTWPARAAWSPTARTWATCRGWPTPSRPRVGIELDVVSGGNSANLDWALSGAPTSAGSTTSGSVRRSSSAGSRSHRRPIDGLHTDAVHAGGRGHRVPGQAVPPWGDVAQNAFGSVPGPVRDRGRSAQAILALGRQDVDPDGLAAPEGVRDPRRQQRPPRARRRSVDVAVGDEMRFGVDYSALLRAMTSPFVARDFRRACRPRVDPPPG